MSCRGVILKATGDLIRSGYTDFQADGSFDVATEEYRTDIPLPPMVKGDGQQWHRWSGTGWIVVGDPLISAKQTRAIKLRDEAVSYIGSRYDDRQQASLQALWIEGISKLWVNRQAKVQSVLDWVNSVLGYFYQKKDEIMAATTVDAVNAVTWSFSQFDATDPKVVVRTVKEMAN